MSENYARIFQATSVFYAIMCEHFLHCELPVVLAVTTLAYSCKLNRYLARRLSNSVLSIVQTVALWFAL